MDTQDPVLKRLLQKKAPPPKAKMIGLHLDPDDMEIFDNLVAKFGTNRSKLARNIIKSYLYGDLK